MTQFLLATFADPLPLGFEATEVGQFDWLRSASASIFPASSSVVKVAPVGDELVSIVDQARNEVFNGAALERTQLGELLVHLANVGEFALFWASDFTDLPRASTVDEAWQVLEPQLRSDNGNWELCVRYSPAAPARGV